MTSNLPSTLRSVERKSRSIHCGGSTSGPCVGPHQLHPLRAAAFQRTSTVFLTMLVPSGPCPSSYQLRSPRTAPQTHLHLLSDRAPPIPLPRILERPVHVSTALHAVASVEVRAVAETTVVLALEGDATAVQ